MPQQPATQTSAVLPANQVTLTGRLTTTPEVRELPSGDPLVTFRLSVPRQATRRRVGSRGTSDWFDCAVWGARVRRSVTRWTTGDRVILTGTLRRRHFRVGGALQTRVEVEVLTGRRLARSEEGHRAQSGRAPAK